MDFDPAHIGHYRLLKEAQNYGRVYVLLNSDDWLLRKKGYVFMSWAERKEMLLGTRWVYDVLPVDDNDGTVCSTLKDFTLPYESRHYRFTWFGNGGDRRGDNTPEVNLCNELGIQLAWGLGGAKASSSSELVAKARSKEGDLVKEYRELLTEAEDEISRLDSLYFKDEDYQFTNGNPVANKIRQRLSSL